jgi:hypothetical protein
MRLGIGAATASGLIRARKSRFPSVEIDIRRIVGTWPRLFRVEQSRANGRLMGEGLALGANGFALVVPTLATKTKAWLGWGTPILWGWGESECQVVRLRSRGVASCGGIVLRVLGILLG